MGRISSLSELTSLASNDYLVVLDSSANIAKKITVANALGIPDYGWTSAGETWIYASATTITVPSDATAKYTAGMYIKVTQSTGGTKYGVITTVASTLLTIYWFNSATLANETISTPFYSGGMTPYGVPKNSVISGKIDWSTLQNNIKSAKNASSISVSNTTQNLASGVSISVTVAEACKALVTVSLGITSTADFEMRPMIYVNGTEAVSFTPAAAQSASGRAEVRGFSYVVDLAAGANTISPGVFLASASSPTLGAGGAVIAALIMGEVTA